MEDHSRLQAFWEYLWHLNEQTKHLLRLHPGAMIELSPSASDAEREFAARLIGDGGQESAAPPDDNGTEDGDGDGDDDGSPFDVGDKYGTRNKIGLVVGPLLFALIMLAPTPEGLSPAGQAVGATTAWVATWWITEAIPIPATSLLPLVLFPLTSALEPSAASSPYADPLIFLFLGGFFIAVTMQRWDLHRRIALRTISAIGTSPRRIILGFMIATAFLSMWVSNTATAMMMTPIGLAVVLQTSELVEEHDSDIPTEQGEFRFGTALMLCITYSALMGGMMTLIGTPPNLVFAGVVSETFNQTITFAQWMFYAVPIGVIGLIFVYVYITRFRIPPRIDTLPGGIDVIDAELERLGPMSREEKIVLAVFSATAVAWISRSYVITPVLPAVGDSTVAIFGALLMFVIPARDDDGSFTFLLDWTTGLNIPWGIILLFGGGLSIAAGFQESGLADWIGSLLSGLSGVPIALLIGVIAVLGVLLTEVTSNTASTAILMPVLAALAVGLSIHPYAAMVAGLTAIAFAVMLPVATPPNAVVFGTGYITMPQMVRAGIGINIFGVIVTLIATLVWLPLVWGINLTQLPPWV